MTKLLTVALVSLTLVTASQALAQPPMTANAPVPTAPGPIHDALLTLPNISRVSSPGISASFDASQEDKKGSVAVVFSNANETFTFSLTGTGAIGKDSKQARPVNERGLDSDATVELSLNWFLWRGRPNAVAQRNFCMEKTHKYECDDDDPLFSADDTKHYLELAYADRNPWTLSFTSELGRSDFNYHDLVDLKPHDDSHQDFSFGAGIGRYSPRWGYIKLSYDYEEAWAPGGKERELCTSIEGSLAGTTECKAYILASPKEAKSHLTTLEWRRFFKGGHAAINPAFTRDLADGVNTFSFPLYFFADKDGGLSGGMRGVWQKGADPAFFFFVGTALSILD